MSIVLEFAVITTVWLAIIVITFEIHFKTKNRRKEEIKNEN